MDKYSTLRSPLDKEEVESNGIILCMYQEGRDVPPGTDIVYPYIILSLNIGGSSHCLYDMKDIRTAKNDLTVFLPGHVIRPLDHSEDYTQAWLVFDPSKFADSELKFSSNDMEFLSQVPLCHLTDDQAQSLLHMLGVIQDIVSFPEEELPKKHRLLEAQLSVAYEIYMSIRRKQDQEWAKDRMGQLYMQFCDLVVANYKVERDINYYSRVLGYDPRYFSKIFRAYNGISPLSWIQQYVATQAKRICNEYPKKTIKEVALELGFTTTANFCRYFKRATGITPMEYKETSAL